MKFFAFKMSILILALDFLPCTDGVFAMKSEKSKIEISKSGPQQDKDCNDDCSPFCTCNCCSGFSINHVLLTGSSKVDYRNKSYNSFLPSQPIKVSLPVWEPPQL